MATIKCPITTCAADVSAPIERCPACGTDLRAYAIAMSLPDICFNDARQAAIDGDFHRGIARIDEYRRMRPDDKEAQLLKAKLQWAVGDKQTAESCFEELSQHASDSNTVLRAKECLNAIRLRDA